jgi:predicted TIM-barrel fold metal-dependent hydrolase
MRYSDIRLIHAHGDKTIPYMAGNGQGPNAALLKKIYVDTAGNTQDTMDDLRELGMLNTQVMFGTDNPYGGEDAVGANLTRLMSFKLSQAELDSIGRSNATKLFPSFA